MSNPDMERIAVIGAGTMGSGIAQVAAMAGCRVSLIDSDPDQLSRAMDLIQSSLQKIEARGELPPESINRTTDFIHSTTDLSATRDSGLVVEAIFENLQAKLDVLHRIDPLLSPGTLVASNTSTLSITTLAEALSAPENFAGLHFFNPVPVLPLVEIVPGGKTGADTVNSLKRFAARIGKDPIVCRDQPGFVVNRLLLPMMNNAIRLVESGAAEPADIDKAMKLGAAHPMGPLELADLVGLDVLHDALQAFAEASGNPALAPTQLLAEKVRAGSLGRKSGNGFYEY